MRLVGSRRYCSCGQSSGYYLKDDLTIKVSGPCVVLGFDNNSLRMAIGLQPESGLGKRFTAFVIPKNCETVLREKRKVESNA